MIVYHFTVTTHLQRVDPNKCYLETTLNKICNNITIMYFSKYDARHPLCFHSLSCLYVIKTRVIINCYINIKVLERTFIAVRLIGVWLYYWWSGLKYNSINLCHGPCMNTFSTFSFQSIQWIVWMLVQKEKCATN